MFLSVHKARLSNATEGSFLLTAVAHDSLAFEAIATNGFQAQRSPAGRLVGAVDPLVEGEIVEVPGRADGDEWHL